MLLARTRLLQLELVLVDVLPQLLDLTTIALLSVDRVGQRTG